jgi:hypothetical protein
MVRRQNAVAATFVAAWRTSQRRAKRAKASVAARVPTPLRRYLRSTKNSAMSATSGSPVSRLRSSTIAKPAMRPSARTRYACRKGSTQQLAIGVPPEKRPSSPTSRPMNSLKSYA